MVVTYLPDCGQLEKMLATLQPQLSGILICNNGPQLPVPVGPDRDIIQMDGNLGIAAAQTTGMQIAFDRGAEFVLQMDQDSAPAPDLVACLLRSYAALTSLGLAVGAIGPTAYHRLSQTPVTARLQRGTPVAGTDCQQERQILSSGSLIPRQSYLQVGGMEDRLFIDGVDFEYCWRLRAHGLGIYRDREARLIHQAGLRQQRLFGLIEVGVPSPVRHYYAFRNSLHLLRRPYVPLYWKVSTVAKLIFKLLCYPLMLDRGRRRSRYMLWGLRDGLRGVYGRLDER